MGIDRILVGDESAGVIVWQTKDVRLRVAWDHVLYVLRIEFLEFAHGYADQVADLLEMEVLADLEGVHLGWHLHGIRSDSVFLAVLDCVHGTYESRDIAPGLAR